MTFDSALHFVTSAAGYIIPFLIVLGIVVFVHEFGHFWVARRLGVKIEAFSLGFGPEIKAWHDRYGTRWRLAWMPLGGYVKMFGDADPTSFGPAENAQALTEDEKKVAFYTQPVGHRFLIVGAGPASNYLFGILVLALLFCLSGQPFSPPVVEKVVPDSAAALAGLQPGDRVVVLDDTNVRSFEEIRRLVAMNTGDPIRLTLERDGGLMDVTVTPKITQTTDRLGIEHKQAFLGIASETIKYKKLSVPRALGHAVQEAYNLSAVTLRGVGQMILGVRGTEELGGPLRIAEMSGKVAHDGVGALFWFIALISINLGLVNLFPVPLLDGGHLLFYTLEKFKGSPLSDRIQEYSARFGAALIVSLMVFAFWNDLVHLRVIAYVTSLFS